MGGRESMSGDGFFSDPHLQEFVASVPWTSFVETGTEEGKTARWVAGLGKPVFTCEIDEVYIANLIGLLPVNVRFYDINSPDFIVTIKTQNIGHLPLFFLDAHWGAYWPLLDEVQAIAANYNKAIIIVHDAAVPGKPNFWTCRGGGKDNEGPENNLAYIRQAFDWRHHYRLFYPTYDAQTPGWLVLFQNCNPTGNLEHIKEASVFK